MQEYDSGEAIWFGALDGVEEGTYPQYRLDPSHRGVAPAGTVVGWRLAPVWKTEALAVGNYGASKSSPVVDVDSVYVGIDDGRLHAIDRATGEIRWSFETRRFDSEQGFVFGSNRGIHGTPAVDECCVYIGDYDGWLYALHKESGDEKWSRLLGHSIGASPVLYGGLIFISVEFLYPDGQVFVLEAEDGRVIYQSPALGQQAHASVTIDPERGLMLVGANNGLFAAHDMVTKELAWEYWADAEIKSTAAVAGDLVYFTSYDFRLHAVDLDTGAARFIVETGSKTKSSPSVHDGRVVFGSRDRFVYCVDALTGEALWEVETGGGVASSPTIVPKTGMVLVGSRDGNLHVISLDEGLRRARYELDGQVTSAPVAVGRELYVSDNSGTIWRFDVE